MLRFAGFIRFVVITIALLAITSICQAFFETPFSTERLMKVDTGQLAAALTLALEDKFMEQRRPPEVYCDIRVGKGETEESMPRCAMVSLIFSDISRFGGKTSEFVTEPDKANLIIFSFSQKDMSDFLQKIQRSKIDLFSEFRSTPEYKVFANGCSIVNFKMYPQKYLIILPELINREVAYDCVTLGVLFYFSYPPALLREKYLPAHRSFYLTGIELSVLCMRNKGHPQFDKFTVTSEESQAWTWKDEGSANYLGCQAH